MLYNKKSDSTRKKLGSFFGSLADRLSMDTTDLIWAVAKNDTEKVRRAMNAGIDPNQTDGIERRALPMAIDQLNEEMISYLLAGGADPNLPTMDGETALYKAVTWGHEPIVKLLLEAGGNPNVATGAGATPMQAAQELGRKSMIELLKNPDKVSPKPEPKPKPIPKPKKKYTSPATEQARASAEKNIALAKKAEAAAKQMKGAAQKAKEIIEKKTKEVIGKTVTAEEAIAKRAANKKKDSPKKAPKPTTASTEKASPKKPTPAKKTTPKKTAPNKKAAAAIPYIKEAGSLSGALVMAIQKENDAALVALLSQIKKEDLNQTDKNGGTPLLTAIELKHAKATGALIDQGADVLTIVSKKGHSPLSLAVSMNSLNLVKFMIDKAEEAALQTALNSEQQLLSSQFIAYNNPKMLDVLLGAGADPNFGGKEGISPLLKGIEKGSIGLLPLYVKHAIDLNQIVEERSLIEWAIKYNRQDWVNGLITEGADIATANENGQTPLEYAESFGDSRAAIIEILKKID